MFTRGRGKNRTSLQRVQRLEPAYAEAEAQTADGSDAGDPSVESGERKPWDFPFAPPPLGPEDLATGALPRFFGGGSLRTLAAPASA